MSDIARAIATMARYAAKAAGDAAGIRRGRAPRVLAVAAGVLIAAFAPLAATGAAVAAPLEAHGALDAFAGDGVAMAWGVLRGKDDASTFVVVRIDADPARYRAVAVTGIDPFTKASQAIVAPQALGGSRTVRVPRARFADLPRTEWRFFANATPAAGDAPALVVEYHGVPDTTPEFDDEAKLAASLAERVERARRGAKP
jgi:hypothetical protein